MAFQWQTFRTRALTAIVFLVVMAIGLLWSRWSFFLLFSVVHFGCWIEYQRLVAKIDPSYQSINAAHRYGIPVGGWMLMLFFTDGQLVLGGFSLQETGWWAGLLFLLLFPLTQLPGKKILLVKTYAHSLLGLLYISLSLALLMDLRNRWTGTDAALSLTIPLLVIFTNWVNDTMAYIVGSLIGKHPFSPISPKKTWEGTIGGAVLAVAFLTWLCWHTGRLEAGHAAAITALGAISGTYGDLFESKLKRMAGVKDSGTLMPGHGGFMDRFDSLLFSSTVVWLYVRIFLA